MSEEQIRRLIKAMQAYATTIAKNSAEVQKSQGEKGVQITMTVGLMFELMADCLREAIGDEERSDGEGK